MRRFTIATLLGLSLLSSGCSPKSTVTTRNDSATSNIAMDEHNSIWNASAEVAIPSDPPPVLDPWMKIPPMRLKAQIDRLLRCGEPQQSHRKCNLFESEGAWARSPTEESQKRDYAVQVWMTVPAEIYDVPPTESLPHAPYRVIHYLLPHWHQADAWLTFALRNARRGCGVGAKVGNALVWLGADFGIQNTYVMTLELAAYRPSIERRHAECIADEAESDTDRHADAIAAGRPWEGSAKGQR